MTRTRWMMILTLVWSSLTALGVFAQADTLLIQSPSSRVAPDGRSIIVELDVWNQGSVATAATTVRLFDGRGVELGSAPLMPLEPQTRQPVVLEAPVESLPAGTRAALFITVGLDALTLDGRGTVTSITVSVPAPGQGTPGEVPAPAQPGIFNLPFSINLDLNDPAQVALAVGIGGLCLLLLWVIWVIVRQVSSRPQPFGVWQPMYPSPMVIDPNTTEGRRYLWQQHTQSDSLPLPCVPGTILARKIVVGAGGGKFDGWRIVGMRSGRYDQYGRISRTHHTAPQSIVRRLDRVARRRKLNEKAAVRTVRPIARALIKDILKHSDRRSAILPIALDIRFKGERDLARMVFELWRCGPRGWDLFDTWIALPTYASATEATEQFGYSFYGQRHDESRKAFERRMEVELTRVFAQLVFKPVPPPVEDTSDHAPATEAMPPAPPTQQQAPVTVESSDEPADTSAGTPAKEEA
ncbi:MAG: hypothetical protein IPK19_09420 [Chloroflexi bacterium]|nr:hypothetical protein [Chloroflexota bacterium]